MQRSDKNADSYSKVAAEQEGQKEDEDDHAGSAIN